MSDNLQTAERVVEALEAIAGRQSLIKFLPDRPSADAIRTLLGAAVRAPNHHRNEPWRFIVLAGKARERLGDAFAACARAHNTKLEAGATLDAVVLAERAKALRSPVVIVVACVRNEHPKAMAIEDIEATAAAVENMLIAAHALGLAAAWRTGTPAYDADVKRHLGLRAEDDIVAFVHVGYALAERPPMTARGPIENVARWDGWEE
jgi:nitroreductase